MLAKLFGAGLSVTRAVGQLFGNELDVVISEHEIKLEMVDPDSIDSEGRSWDPSHFLEGNIHFEGIANPIKPVIDEEVDGERIITSDRYKTYMKNKLMEDIVNETTDSSGLTLFKVLIILATVQFSMTGIILYFLLF